MAAPDADEPRHAPPAQPLRIGERFERSRCGQVVLSLVMLVLIVSVFAWNYPAGTVHDDVNKVTAPIVQSLGLEQDWALFAPIPRTISVGVYAEITMRDGTTRRWFPPHNGLFFSPYRNYRWQKYVERLRDDDYADELPGPTAQWLVRQNGGSAKVARIALIRTFQPVQEPGTKDTRGPVEHYTFYTLDVPR